MHTSRFSPQHTHILLPGAAASAATARSRLHTPAARRHRTRAASPFKHAKHKVLPSLNCLRRWLNTAGNVQKARKKLAWFCVWFFVWFCSCSASCWLNTATQANSFHYIVFYTHLAWLNLRKLANRWKWALEWKVTLCNKPCPQF